MYIYDSFLIFLLSVWLPLQQLFNAAIFVIATATATDDYGTANSNIPKTTTSKYEKIITF